MKATNQVPKDASTTCRKSWLVGLRLRKRWGFRNHMLSFWMTVFGTCLCLTLPAYGEKGESTDPTYSLHEIIELVLKHNPLMTGGKGVVEEKQGQEVAATAYPNPSIDVQAGYGQVLDPSNGISVTERYVTLSQPFEWPAKRLARRKAAEAAVASAQSALNELRLDLTARVKRAFFDLILAKKKAQLAFQNLKTVQNLARAVQERIEAGEAPPFEAVKINVELLKVKKEVTRTRGAVRVAQVSLNTLTAGVLGSDFAVQGDFADPPKNLQLDRLSKQAFDRHPSILKLEQLVEETEQRYLQQKEERIPNITLNGSYQRDAGREGYLGGVSVALPLWYQRQGEISQALGNKRQAEATLVGVQKDLAKRVVQHFQISQVAAAQIATYEEGLLKQAHEAVRIAQVSFRFGEASLLEVLDAQRILWKTLGGYAEARFDLSVALAELDRLTGKDLSS